MPTNPTPQTNGRDLAHRQEYKIALRSTGHDGPAWDDLTEVQRENIRAANRAYWRELADFGRSLANG